MSSSDENIDKKKREGEESMDMSQKPEDSIPKAPSPVPEAPPKDDSSSESSREAEPSIGQEGDGCTDEKSIEDTEREEDWEIMVTTQSPEETTRAPFPDEQTDPVHCPTCNIIIGSINVIYMSNLNYHISIKPKHEGNEKDSSKENQNQAAAIPNKSLWCPKCKINLVSFKPENNDTQFKLKIGLSLKDETNLLSSEQEQPKQKKGKPNTASKGYLLWPRVKVCCIFNGDTFGSDKSIIEKVRNMYSTTVLEEASSQDSYVILAFCPITSRAGSDVESAMTNLQVSSTDKPVILVLMHHTRDAEYSTGGRKWSELYKNIVLEVHFLFHETIQGLLNCQQNDQAIKILQQKLFSYWKLTT